MAQTPTGVISGVVQDSSSALVAQAEVTIRNLASGLVRSTTTADNGTFNVPLLPVGKYSITARMKGFKTSVRSVVEVDVQQAVHEPISLEIGETAETVG